MPSVLTAFKHALTFGASTAICENAFSTLRNIFMDHRHVMLPRRKVQLVQPVFKRFRFREGIQPESVQLNGRTLLSGGSATTVTACNFSKGKTWFNLLHGASLGFRCYAKCGMFGFWSVYICAIKFVDSPFIFFCLCLRVFFVFFVVFSIAVCL